MPDPNTETSIHRFAHLEIDGRRRELRVDGRLEAVEPRVYDLIAILACNRDRAFGKDELIARLWNRPVSDASLSQLVYKARRALGETEGRRFIQTVHGHGFRWTAKPLDPDTSAREAVPTPPAAAAQPPAVARRGGAWRALALVLACTLLSAVFVRSQLTAAGDSGRRILVLPVVDRSGDAGLAWAQRGLMGLVASVIAQRPGIVGLQHEGADMHDARLDDPDRRQSLRDHAGADDIVFMTLDRAGGVLRLVVVLEGRDGRREDTLYGSDAAALAVDAGRRIDAWTAARAGAPSAPIAGLDGYLAETFARGIEAYLDGRFEHARSYFSICAAQRPELVWPRLHLATTLLRLGRTPEALELLAGIEAGAAALEPAQARHVRMRMAAARLANGDLAAAREGFLRVRDEAESSNDALSLRIASEGLGEAALAAGDHAQAEYWLRRVLDMDRRSGDRRREARSLANLGSVSLHRGDLAEAAQQYLRVADLARELDLPALRQCSLQALAMIRQAQGQYVSAQPLHLQALQLARDAGDVRGEVIAHAGLAKSFAAHGRVEPAQRHARRALELSDAHALTVEHAFALVAAGHAARAAGHPEEASRLHEEAADAFGRMRNWSVLLGQALWLARDARERGDAVALARWVARGAEIARAHGEAAGVAALGSAVRAQHQAARGDRAAAIASLDAALRESRSARDALRGRAVALELGRVALGAGELARAEAALEELGAAQSEDPHAIRLHVDWLQASGREREADAERARLDRLAAALEEAAQTSLRSMTYDIS